jgi:predicted transcriptional regulator
MCGEKKFEFRKNVCKRNVDKIVIYSTSPVMKVVGEAEVEEVLVDEPQKIWNVTEEYSGVEREFFDEYYEGREQAVAYKLKSVVEYDKPKMLNEYGIKSAPQSFCYLSE